jgi:predicted CoA-binding protein
MGKNTLVLGASANPDRFSYKAIQKLQRMNHEVIAIGRKDVNLENIKIRKGMPKDIDLIHTVTMYINAQNQKEYYNYILSLHPERIIFNPGTINPELADLAKKEGIEVIDNCMLSMLNSGIF